MLCLYYDLINDNLPETLLILKTKGVHHSYSHIDIGFHVNNSALDLLLKRKWFSFIGKNHSVYYNKEQLIPTVWIDDLHRLEVVGLLVIASSNPLPESCVSRILAALPRWLHYTYTLSLCHYSSNIMYVIENEFDD